jgi:hypothetical protein
MQQETGFEIPFVPISGLRALMMKITEALKLIVIRPSMNKIGNVCV